VLVTFFQNDANGQRINQQPGEFTGTDSNGYFAAHLGNVMGDNQIVDWFASVTVSGCPGCWKPFSGVFPLEAQLDFHKVAEVFGEKAFLAVVAHALGVPDVPVILSTEFISEAGAAVIQLEKNTGCVPEPTTFMLSGTSLLLFMSWRFRHHAGGRGSRRSNAEGMNTGP